MRKSEALDARDVVEVDRSIAGEGFLLAKAQNGEGKSRHSGLSIMPVMPSSMAGLSVPEMDWLFLPCSISSKPVHHLFKMTVRRSRSSARSFCIEGCEA